MKKSIVIIIVCLLISLLVLSLITGCSVFNSLKKSSSSSEKLGGLEGLFISQDKNAAYHLLENGLYQSGTFNEITGIFTPVWECIYTVRGEEVKLYNVPEGSESANDWIVVGGAKIINGKVEAAQSFTSYNKDYSTDESKLKSKLDIRQLGIFFVNGSPSTEGAAIGPGFFEGTWTRATQDVSFEMDALFDTEGGNPNYGTYLLWMPYNIFDEKDPKYYELRGSCEATSTELIIYSDSGSKTVCPRNGYTFYIPSQNIFGDPMFAGTYFPATGVCKFYPKEKEQLATDTTQTDSTETSAELTADTSIENLLIGKWLMLQDDTGGSVFWEFQEGGIFLMYAEGGSTNTNVLKGTYTLNGKKLYASTSAPAGESGNWNAELTIVSITNDSMTITGDGETHTMTKVK